MQQDVSGENLKEISLSNFLYVYMCMHTQLLSNSLQLWPGFSCSCSFQASILEWVANFYLTAVKKNPAVRVWNLSPTTEVVSGKD